MTKKFHEYGFLFWLHIFIIFFPLFAVFLFSWKILAIYIFLVWVQWWILGGCFITAAQFHKKKSEFGRYYLAKIGIHLTPMGAFIKDYVFPIFTLLLAVYWQVVLMHTPLLF